MAELRTYRNRLSGKVTQYPSALAQRFADILEEVPEDAKPLAYTSIPAQAIEDYFDALDEDTEDTDDTEEVNTIG